jgi:hypothetical protein
MFISWVWNSPETLLGIMTANDITIATEGEQFSAGLISIGIIIVRIDIIINKQKVNGEN